MKKYFLLLVVFISSIVSAQIASTKIAIPNTFGQIVSPAATASIYKITNTTAGYVLFYAQMNQPSTQDFVVKLDSVSGNHTNVAVSIYGQKSELKGDWTQIGSTVNWKGTTADTVILVSNASANRYQNFKITYTGTGTGVTKINKTFLKLWLE